MELTTVLYEMRDHIATITLNRPKALNSFNQAMCDEFAHLWWQIDGDDDLHAVVLRAAGDLAFSRVSTSNRAGTARETSGLPAIPARRSLRRPGRCGSRGVRDPRHGRGGACYWVSESDMVIRSDDATFFDPHVTYGMTAALAPIGPPGPAR